MYMNPKYLYFFILLACYIEFSVCYQRLQSKKSKILSRKRRYVTFPEGSSFSCAACMTVGLIGDPGLPDVPGVYTFGMNWGVAFELPNETQSIDAFKTFGGLKPPAAKRRNRRDLYQKLESIIDNMGYNGRDCILKTLCETTQRILPNGSNMMEEIFRRLFTLPITKVLPIEPSEHAIYDAAHRLGTMMEDCDVYKCPISLVDLVKGYYNARAPNTDIISNPWSLFSNSFL